MRSPDFRPLLVPFSTSERMSPEMSCGSVNCGRIAFHSGWATIGSTVSNVLGSSPGPGMLCTFSPAATVTGDAACSGAPGASSTVKARWTVAATPGRGS
jgi:hypothetical protein